MLKAALDSLGLIAGFWAAAYYRPAESDVYVFSCAMVFYFVGYYFGGQNAKTRE